MISVSFVYYTENVRRLDMIISAGLFILATKISSPMCGVIKKLTMEGRTLYVCTHWM